jgi:two-component system response regulator YesN
MALRSGLDFLEGLGARAARDSYIVILSGYDDFSYAQRAMRGGAREYILKPISRFDLAASLRRATEAFRAFQESAADLTRSANLVRESALRYVALSESLKAEDYESLARQSDFGRLLDSYRVCAWKRSAAAPARPWQSGEARLRLVDPFIPYLDLIVVPSDLLLRGVSLEGCGYSDPVSGLAAFPCARAQAIAAWKRLFLDPSLKVAGPDGQRVVEDFDPAAELEGMLRHPELFPSKAESAARLASFLDPRRFRKLRPERVASTFGFVARELERQDERASELYDPFAFGSLEQALDCCARLVDAYLSLRRVGLGEQGAASAELTKSRRLIEAALRFVQSHFPDPGLTMAMVSNQLSLSYNYFSELFKSVTGKNFVAYLRQLRIAQARVLLRETNLMVEDIAAKVGYADAKAFSKAFKADVGCSPSEYRLAERDII